MSFKNTAVNL